MKSVIVIFMMVLSSLSQAESLDDITSFADSVCGNLPLKGTIESSELKAAIKGNIKPKVLSKILGTSISADGSYVVNGKEYKGLPYESLPEQISGQRACKKEIAFLLIEERKQLKNSTAFTPRYEVINNGFASVLMREPNFKEFSNPFSKSPLRIKTLMDGTKLEYLKEFSEDTGHSPISWYQVRVISGPDKGLGGWLPYRNVKAI